MKAQLFAIRQRDADMVMRLPRIRRRNHAKTARHAEVNEQGAHTFDLKQQILRPPAHGGNFLSLDLVDRFGNRLTQVATAHDHLLHTHAEHMRLDAPAGGLNFGELGHVGGRWGFVHATQHRGRIKIGTCQRETSAA